MDAQAAVGFDDAAEGHAGHLEEARGGLLGIVWKSGVVFGVASAIRKVVLFDGLCLWYGFGLLCIASLGFASFCFFTFTYTLNWNVRPR